MAKGIKCVLYGNDARRNSFLEREYDSIAAATRVGKQQVRNGYWLDYWVKRA